MLEKIILDKLKNGEVTIKALAVGKNCATIQVTWK